MDVSIAIGATHRFELREALLIYSENRNSFIIGSAIQSLVDGKAHRNVERRWIQLFVDLKDQLEKIRDSIPHESYYNSEEFQTLLALAYEQLWTTHDREKLRMLAAALANSGSAS
jgi:hypothetical protein